MDFNNIRSKTLSLRIGFWSALLFTASAVAYGVIAGIFFAVYPVPAWTDIKAYASFMSSAPQRLFGLCQLMAFLSGPIFTILLCSIHAFVPEEKKILTRISICFSVVFVTLASMCYFVQFTILPQNIMKGQLNGLENFVQLNTDSFTAAIVILGWGFFLGLSAFSLAPVFSGSKAENRIRLSFTITGVFCILDTIGFVIQNIFLSLVSTMIFDISLIAACLALCVLFKNMENQAVSVKK